jgi:TolA-binding protein
MIAIVWGAVWALPALAETTMGPGATGDAALSEFAKNGILGALSLVLMMVIFYLYKRVEKLQDQLIDMTGKVSQLMTANNMTMERQNSLMDKLLDRTAALAAQKQEH